MGDDRWPHALKDPRNRTILATVMRDYREEHATGMAIPVEELFAPI